MLIWALMKKDLRLMLRDRLAAAILLVLPILFIFILGLLLGEGFGQKPDNRVRVSVVDLDDGYLDRQAAIQEGLAWFTVQPGLGLPAGGAVSQELGAAALASMNHSAQFPYEPWSKVVIRDLAETGGIRVEIIPTRAEAERLCREGRRAAILVFNKDFSKRVHRSSFLGGAWPDVLRVSTFWPSPGLPINLALAGLLQSNDDNLPPDLIQGINPFYRDGVKLDELRIDLLEDQTQPAEAAVIKQVAQVSLLRVILPWMIGRAFEKISDPSFLGLMIGRAFEKNSDASFLGQFLLTERMKSDLGEGVKIALKKLFARYELTGKTWAALTLAVRRR